MGRNGYVAHLHLLHGDDGKEGRTMHLHLWGEADRSDG